MRGLLVTLKFMLTIDPSGSSQCANSTENRSLSSNASSLLLYIYGRFT
jgi:hypothetical protein